MNAPALSQAHSARLSFATLVLFALPTLPMYLLRGPAFSILPALYAERFAIPLTVISGVLLLVRVADGALDMAVGWGTDATRHRWGGRKSWFLVGSLMTVACIFQLYVPPPDASAVYFGGWFFIAYVAWTVNEIPYGAWANELTTDYRERCRIAVARQYFNVASAALLGLIPFLPFLPNRDMSFDALAVVAWVVAIALPPISLLCVWKVPAGVVSVRAAGHSVSESWAALRGNRTFLRFVAAAGLGGLADALQSGVGFLIIDSYLGLGAAIGYILLQWALASTVGVWVAERMLRRMEKHHVMALAAALAAAVMLLNSLLAPDTPHVLWAYLVASFLQFVGGIVVDMCPQAMVGDIVDHDRMKTGVNRSGQYVAALTFVRKAVFGIGTSLAIFVAGSFGFEPGQAPYSPQAVFGLKLVGFWIPALCCALTALVMWRYPLDSRRHAIVCRRNGRMASRVEQGETMVARHPLEASRGAA